MSNALAAIQRTSKLIKARKIEPDITSDNVSYRDVTAWIEHEFYIPERKTEPNQAMPLAPYQRAMLREAHRTMPDGKFVYDLVLWSDIKKSAKSSIAAAVILYRALNTPYGSFKVVANDLKQADSRVFYYIRRAIELNLELTSRATIRNYKITLDNNAVIEAVAVDPKGEAGGNDDMIEFTELHAADSKAAFRMWSEMTISPTKHGYSQRWVDSYAGHSGEAPILEPLYEQCVKQGHWLDLGIPGLEVYANGRMLCLWNTQQGLLEWQTPDYYASEAQTLTPNEYRRMHQNQWVTSADVFVPSEWWDSCAGEIPVFAPDTPIVVGMDAAVSGDCFALVGVSRVDETVYVRFVQTWTPPKDGKIDFSEVDTFIRDQVVTRYNVVQICYDPYMLHDMATRLERDGVAWMYEFSQNLPRLVADKELYDTIRDRRLIHSNHPTLTEHVKNANAATDPKEHTLRIVKRADHLKIDSCVALSMAAHEARRLSIS
jgi:hypothetical protein